MIDIIIFGFGLGVVVIVGSALAILINTNNRSLEPDTGVPAVRKVAAGEVASVSRPEA